MAAFRVLNRQFQQFIDSHVTLDYDGQMTDKYFVTYTRIKVKQFRETLLQHMGNVKKSVAERTRHQRHYLNLLLGSSKDIYAAVDSCETAQEIWLRVQQMMKGSDIGIQEKKAKLFNEWERFTSTDGESIESYYHNNSLIDE
ncbi:hypothetical protein Tco_1326425 [Tanacetum coccineum]